MCKQRQAAYKTRRTHGAARAIVYKGAPSPLSSRNNARRAPAACVASTCSASQHETQAARGVAGVVAAYAISSFISGGIGALA